MAKQKKPLSPEQAEIKAMKKEKNKPTLLKNIYIVFTFCSNYYCIMAS